MRKFENEVVASFQPKWVELIVNLIKKWEVRKDFPKIQTPFKCKIYCTKSNKNPTLVLSASKLGVEMGLSLDQTAVMLNIPIERENRDVANAIMNGRIVGEFICDKILPIRYNALGRYECPAEILAETCLTQTELVAYGKGRPLFAWHISELKVYKQTLPINSLLKTCQDPYSYCQACRYGHIVYPSDVETAADMEGCSYEEYCTNRMSVAPQSWCYTRPWAKNQVPKGIF